jgi:hypothetical protein
MSAFSGALVGALVGRRFPNGKNIHFIFNLLNIKIYEIGFMKKLFLALIFSLAIMQLFAQVFPKILSIRKSIFN